MVIDHLKNIASKTSYLSCVQTHSDFVKREFPRQSGNKNYFQL